MTHLDPEALARLVDERPDAEERGHLNRCRRCRDELDALRTQTLGLSHLPRTRPPADAWERLEVRLRELGLIRSGATRVGSARGGLQAAAAVLLLLAGTALGAGLPFGSDGNDGGPALSSTDSGRPAARTASAPPSLLAAFGMNERELTADEAADLVALTERWYLEALLAYREHEGLDPAPAADDPLTRFAALETLMAAGQAAVRELPADPFLNGLLLNMRAEREATLRGIQASTTQNWY